jgi:phosphoribosylaminoimidazolecarboxamide formyltransferase/IMP cyclohydrolase
VDRDKVDEGVGLVRGQAAAAVMVAEFVEVGVRPGRAVEQDTRQTGLRKPRPASRAMQDRFRLAAPVPRTHKTRIPMAKLALLSVSDKRGLVNSPPHSCNSTATRLLSTGGTAKLLAEKGLPVTEVSQHTGFPEMMEGRVKTLHPKIHGGLLCRRDKADHLAAAAEHGIDLIDLVVVNLYPFEQTVAKPHVEFEEAIENIDIGGPSMLRSAAKNHDSVTVVCDPADYGAVLAALAEPAGLGALRRKLALKVFQRTGSRTTPRSRYLEKQAEGPDLEALSGFPGENSLTAGGRRRRCVTGRTRTSRRRFTARFMSTSSSCRARSFYNNILDITSATYLIGEFEKPTVAILKHTNPCGVASADTLEAWDKAYATDRQAPFGGIIIVNQTIGGALAALIAEIFTEVIIAPRFSPRRSRSSRRKRTCA